MAKATHTTPRAVLARMPRETIHAAIEALLEELDRRDGDPDREDGHDAEWDCQSFEHPALSARSVLAAAPAQVPSGVYIPDLGGEVRHA